MFQLPSSSASKQSAFMALRVFLRQQNKLGIRIPSLHLAPYRHVLFLPIIPVKWRRLTKTHADLLCLKTRTLQKKRKKGLRGKKSDTPNPKIIGLIASALATIKKTLGPGVEGISGRSGRTPVGVIGKIT